MPSVKKPSTPKRKKAADEDEEIEQVPSTKKSTPTKRKRKADNDEIEEFVPLYGARLVVLCKRASD